MDKNVGSELGVIHIWALQAARLPERILQHDRVFR